MREAKAEIRGAPSLDVESLSAALADLGRSRAKHSRGLPAEITVPAAVWVDRITAYGEYRVTMGEALLGGDMDPELTTLTSIAASTVVKLLATSAWEQAKTAVGGLWRRVHPERAERVEAELEETRTEVLAARRVGDEQVEQALVGEWQGRLRRVVTADPQLVEDLRRVVMELRAALADIGPTEGAAISMQATAFGDSRVNQAGRDVHVTER